MTTQLTAWMDLISYFYDGRIFDLHDAGREMQEKHSHFPFGLLERFMSANMAGMASGFTTASPFSQGLLRYMDRFVIGEERVPSLKYAVV
jgi:hypothetical protein